MSLPKLFSICLLFICLVLSSCEKEALSILPGEWEILDIPGGYKRGAITFNEDGTGKVVDADIFLATVGQSGGEADLSWEVLSGGADKGEILRVIVKGYNGDVEQDYPIKAKSKNRIQLSAVGVFIIDTEHNLVR